MKLKTTKHFNQLEDSDKRITVFQGGSRSAKTYNVVVWIVYNFLKAVKEDRAWTASIVRKTRPALLATVFRDFKEIAQNIGLYRDSLMNKTSGEFRVDNAMIEFFSTDDEVKVRGRKRNVLFINEANELKFIDYQQLILRTEDKVILDYNPSEHFWVMDRVITREDAELHISTYRDNPFLAQALIDEIELLAEVDAALYKVYGLGLLANIKGLVFPEWYEVDMIPKEARLVGYGLDFGFTNDPTTIIGVYRLNDDLYLDELLYKRGLTNPDIVDNIGHIVKRELIIADSAEPKSIAELNRLQLNVMGAVKGKDSIRHGINTIKRFKIHVTGRSTNVKKELKNYKYKEDKEGITNAPIDAYNHTIDAIRYIVSYKIVDEPVYSVR